MGEKLDILVVEDNPDHQRSIELLTQAGHKVDLAEDFSKAIEYLELSLTNNLSRYVAVLSDLMIPFGEGNEFILNTVGRLDYQDSVHPLGYAVALQSARVKVPLIGILTDMNHHSSPIANTFDLFYNYYLNRDAKSRGENVIEEDHNLRNSRVAFKLNDSLFAMFDKRDFDELYAKKGGRVTSEKTEAEMKGCDPIYIKNWLALLGVLLKNRGTFK